MSTISNRKQAFSQPQTNPSTKFIEWKSNDKCFSFYDRETSANVSIQLPFKFLVLDELHTVKGWNDASSSQINSNEVKFISRDEMTVKPFKGNEIAKGLYKDIKEKIKAAGGHYVKSVYCMLEDGSIANLQLKGAACQSYGDFTAKTRSRLTDEWVVVDKAIDGKKGAVKYTTPGFAFDKSLSESEVDLADEAYNVLEAYLKTYLVKSQSIEAIAPIESDEAIEDEDLDF
jgi:hypothetical protein